MYDNAVQASFFTWLARPDKNRSQEQSKNMINLSSEGSMLSLSCRRGIEMNRESRWPAATEINKPWDLDCDAGLRSKVFVLMTDHQIQVLIYIVPRPFRKMAFPAPTARFVTPPKLLQIAAVYLSERSDWLGREASDDGKRDAQLSRSVCTDLDLTKPQWAPRKPRCKQTQDWVPCRKCRQRLDCPGRFGSNWIWEATLSQRYGVDSAISVWLHEMEMRMFHRLVILTSLRMSWYTPRRGETFWKPMHVLCSRLRLVRCQERSVGQPISIREIFFL
ncbi:hypothetical protein QBC43DRAFT_73247 [Cladorrhinum sp. PSN259]|nr:hypothetical protein QBC43DRAFT_73247 [Cladorrhinum sp. PSN259]